MRTRKQRTRRTLVAAASGPTAPVPKDPQPSVDRIDELARRILVGDILLPRFQRDFVWNRKQILALLDSVARGYPIGSILLWQSRQELRSNNRIADLDINLPRPDYPVNYLLDGQQRLSTICGAMFWRGDDPRSRWNTAYDLRTRKFLHLDTLDEPPLHQIRASKLSDASVYFKQVARLHDSGNPDGELLSQRAEALFNRFKDYKIATVTLGDMSIQDVAPIFERINSTGTRLTIVDLMRAATWSPEFDLVEAIDDILEELKQKSFGAIDRKVVLRNLSAAAGGSFSVQGIDALRNLDSAKLSSAAANTSEAYKLAVDFLATQVGVPGAGVMPYSNQLTVLAEVLRLLPKPTASQYAAISQWFWGTALSGHFSGWNTGQMSDDLAAVRDFASGQAAGLLVDTAMPDANIWVSRTFRSNNAHSKLLAIVLAHHHPLDLLTGQTIDVSQALAWPNVKEFHHVFPKDYLRSKGEKANRANSLANIIMLTSASNREIGATPPSGYLPRVATAAGGQLQKWLASNLISLEAYEAALADEYSEFLGLRAKAIHAAIRAKVGQ